jgi:gluconate 2-dehydrogenase gamma chain
VINLPQAWTNQLAAYELAHHPQMGGSGVRRPVPFKYFTPEQAACVEAITEQIIPADQDPGAKWAGVVHFIDLSLAGEFAELRPIYRAGLSRLGELTKAVSDRPFPDLDFAQQTRILEKLQSDTPGTQSSASGQDFFALVRRQTIEGFFGDPKYGGNRDYVGWKVLKFEG